MKKNADIYLDTINSAFALSSVESKYKKAIDSVNASNLKAQNELKDLMDQQLNKLKTKDKLTQYDIERAEKRLELKQAEIALEEAQSNKTSMRLARDSQGNYNYEYVAEESDVFDAEQKIRSLQEDLYNFDKERLQENLDQIYDAWVDLQQRISEVILSDDSEEQKIQKITLLRQGYGNYVNALVEENQNIRTNLRDSAFAAYAEFYEGDYENYISLYYYFHRLN